MKRIIENVKAPFVIVLFGAMILLSALGISGCAGMYNERGELTQETQAAISSTSNAVRAITDVAAPAASPFVALGSAAVGSVLSLIGAVFYNRQNKTSNKV